MPSASVRTWVTAPPGLKHGRAPQEGSGEASVQLPIPVQSAATLQVTDGLPVQRPSRVTTMLASTSPVSTASTSPEIVPVEKGRRAASETHHVVRDGADVVPSADVDAPGVA